MSPTPPPAGARRRPATGLVAILAAVSLSCAALLTPASPTLAHAAGRAAAPESAVTARALAGTLSAQTLVTADRYRTYQATKPESVRGIVVMGSSELQSLAPQNPARSFSTQVSDTDIFITGRGHVQSLPHAIELAALAPDLEPRRVVLILSPQWFSAEGLSAGAFEDVYSATFFSQALANDALTTDTKDRLRDRVAELRGADAVPPPSDPGQIVRESGWRQVIDQTALAATAPFAARPEMLKESGLAGYHLPSISGDGGTEGVAHDAIDWDQWQQQAEDQGRAAITNNDFFVEDGYYTTYVAPALAERKDSMVDVDYAGDSPEWRDLDLFLRVARDLGVDVLLVSVPVNGRWYDYCGYPAERRVVYYDKIRSVAASWDVPLADFSGEEYTPYFLYDIMHLGWKGWLDVTRASVDFGWSS